MLDYSIFEKGIPTRSDLKEIVLHYLSEITNEERSRTLVLIQYGVENELIDPTEMLIVSLPFIKDSLHLVLIGYIFRLGADPNEYVSRKDAFPIHVLLYAIGCIIANGIGDEIFIRFIINLFVYFGAFVDKPSVISDENEKLKIKKMIEIDPSLAGASRKLRDVANIREYSVRKWIETQIFIEVRELANELEVMPPDQKKVFGLVTDDPSLVYIDDTIPRFDDIILSRSVNVGKRLPLSGDFEHLRIYNGMTEGLTLCSYSVFEEMFEFFIDVGMRTSFYDINCLITEIISDRFTVTRSILVDMLIYAAERGAIIDGYQLRSFGATIASRIEEAYREQYWKKECLTLGPPSNRLRAIALNLSLDYDAKKKELCQAITNLLQKDEKTLVTAFKRRQKQRLYSTLSTAEDFLDSENSPIIECVNEDYLNADPFSFNDIQLAFYHGDKGAFCFTSDRFEDLLRSGTNPVNGEILPSRFLYEIDSQLKILKSLQIDPSKLITVDKALRETKKEDKITTKESDDIIKSIESLMVVNNVDKEKIRSVDADKLNEILKILGFNQVYLPLLNRELLFVTFCRAVFDGMKDADIDTKKTFVSALMQI